MLANILGEWPLSRGITSLLSEYERALREDFSVRGERSPLRIENDGKTYSASLDLPGMDPATINVELNGANLQISCARSGREAGRMIVQERSTEAFKGTIRLPFAVDAENVEATYKEGVLTVKLIRKEREQPKKIEIKVH